MSDTVAPRQYVPLTCHGHSRPVPHLSFSPLEKEDVYYMISACKGLRFHLLQPTAHR
jgi:serine-threonine kinase receptor-associated protein